MSCRSWRSQWGARQCAIAAVALLATFGAALSRPPSISDPTHSNEYLADNRNTPAPPPTFPGSQYQTRSNFHLLCADPGSAEEADLCEQWRMAEATEVLVALTDRQIWITGVEALLLVASVAFTAWAALAASRAARAAERSVSIADDTAKRQLRAYVHIRDARVLNFGNNEPIKISASVHNFGNTPAYSAEISTSFCTGSDPQSGDHFVSAREPDKRNRATIPPGSSTIMTIEFPKTLDASEIDNLRNGKLAIWFFGEVRYRDAFDEVRLSRYRVKYGGDTGCAPSGLMTTEPDGNESD